MPIELGFILMRLAEMAEADESLGEKQPWKAVQLLGYLEANGFTNYIASGGDRDFMRPITEEIYNIPSERVIGSSNALSYLADEHGGTITYAAEPDVFDDGPVKPIRIWSRIGRRPVLAGQLERRHPDAAVCGREGSARPAPRRPARRRGPRVRLQGRGREVAGDGGRAWLDGGQHEERLGHRLRRCARVVRGAVHASTLLKGMVEVPGGRFRMGSDASIRRSVRCVVCRSMGSGSTDTR
jgi:hypothetical protein